MSSHDSFRTLAKVSEGLYKEKGSKFLSFAYPVSTEEQVKERLEELKKAHYSARHHCYAFVLKPQEGQEEMFRASDAGEPSHSAGDPILGQIRSQQLHDVLVVVVRYFGGTKLGVGGLVNAYKTAAAEALANNTVVKKYVERPLSIDFPYEATNSVMQIIDQFDITIRQQSYSASCYFQLAIRASDYEQVTQLFADLDPVTLKH